MADTQKNELVKLQKIELNIAKEFATLCDRHGLTYYMIGGTLLGAVRHKGFIPWDDDMDFAMMRDDYEKFSEIAPKELPSYMKLTNYKNTPSFQYYCTRVFDINTKIIDERIGDESRNTYASIDVFPIDGSPNMWLFRKMYFFRVLFHRVLMSMCHKDSIDKKRKRGLAERYVLSLMEKLPIDKFTTANKEKDKIDKIMRQQNVKGSKYIGNLMGYYRTKEMVPAEFYGDGAMYSFEDTEFRGISMYDEYLKWQYGDYMKLPPKEERELKTHYKIIELHGERIEK